MGTIEAAAIFLGAHSGELAVVLGAAVVSAAGAAGVVTCVFVHLPEDYLQRHEITPLWPDRPRWMQIAARAGKNVLGVGLIGAGAVLALPGVIGPGTPLLLAGLVITDIPGKQRLVRRILGHSKVLHLVNRTRACFGRPPLSTKKPKRRRAKPGASPRPVANRSGTERAAGRLR